MDNRRDQRNTGWALLLGLVAGGYVGYYLNSEKGREFRRTVADNISDYEKTVRETMSEKSTQLADGFNSTLETVKGKANTTLENVKTKANRTVESFQDRFNKGVNEAEIEIEATADAIKRSTKTTPNNGAKA